jgi:hypothetical protein
VGGAIDVVADVVQDPVGSAESFAETVSLVVTDPGQFVSEVAEFAEPFAGLAGQAIGGPIGSALAKAAVGVAQGESPFDSLQETIGLLGGPYTQAAGALLGGGIGDAAASFLGGGNLLNAAAGILGGGDLASIATTCMPELPDFGGGFGIPGLGDLGQLAGIPGLGGLGPIAENLLGGGSLLTGFESFAQNLGMGQLGDLAGPAAAMLLGEGGPQAMLTQALGSLGVPSSLVSTLTEHADAAGSFGFGSINTLVGNALGAAAGTADTSAFASALEAIGVPTEVLTTVAQQAGLGGDGDGGGGLFGSVLDNLRGEVQNVAGAAEAVAAAAPAAGTAAAIDALDGGMVQSVLGTLARSGGLDQTLDSLDADGLRALITNMVQPDAPTAGAAGAADDVLGGDMVTTVAGMDADANAAAVTGSAPDAAPDATPQPDLTAVDQGAGLSDPVMDSAMQAAPDQTAPAEDQYAAAESDFAEQDAADEALPDQALDDIFGDGSAPA